MITDCIAQGLVIDGVLQVANSFLRTVQCSLRQQLICSSYSLLKFQPFEWLQQSLSGFGSSVVLFSLDFQLQPMFVNAICIPWIGFGFLSGVLWGWVDVKIQRIMEKKDEYYNKGHG